MRVCALGAFTDVHNAINRAFMNIRCATEQFAFLLGKDEVMGSTPIISSTLLNEKPHFLCGFFVLCFS